MTETCFDCGSPAWLLCPLCHHQVCVYHAARCRQFCFHCMITLIIFLEQGEWRPTIDEAAGHAHIDKWREAQMLT